MHEVVRVMFVLATVGLLTAVVGGISALIVGTAVRKLKST